MPFPFMSWNSAKQDSEETKFRSSQGFLLKRAVKQYVEDATDYTPNFAGPQQLENIRQYCREPDLLDIILDVLSERMLCAWPWNIKSLDVLNHLLSNGLTLLQTHPVSRQILTNLSSLSTSPPDDPVGTATHVQTKANECLHTAGYTPGTSTAYPFSQYRGAWFSDSPTAMKQASENERERLEDERKREILWAGYNMSRREKANRGKIWKDYSTSSNNVPAPHPSTLSAWTSVPNEAEGFSFSTTTVGPPSADHFRFHQTNYAKAMEQRFKK